jgi:hypothetical protein
MVISYNLYTRNPEDIKIVVPYAIEATKAQSLRDAGVELLPFEEHEGNLTEEEYYSLRFYLPTDDCPCLTWVRPRYAKMHVSELMTNIVKQFPHVEFESTIYNSENPQEEAIELWDGKEWIYVGCRIDDENCTRIHCTLPAFIEKYGCAVHYFMDEAEAVRELHENNIVPADYTTIASITAFLEQQGCVFNVSYDKISE